MNLPISKHQIILLKNEEEEVITDRELLNVLNFSYNFILYGSGSKS